MLKNLAFAEVHHFFAFDNQEQFHSLGWQLYNAEEVCPDPVLL